MAKISVQKGETVGEAIARASFRAVTPAEDERLGQLIEEMGESLQMIGKTMRHGYESSHPDYDNITNRQNLEKELGQVLAMIKILIVAGDVDELNLHVAQNQKFVKLLKFTHHKANLDVLRRLISTHDCDVSSLLAKCDGNHAAPRCHDPECWQS
jgi:hypothetical protein